MRGRHRIYLNTIDAIPVVVASLGFSADGDASSCCTGDLPSTTLAGSRVLDSRPTPIQNPVHFDIFTDGDSQASTASSSRRECGVSPGIDAGTQCEPLMDPPDPPAVVDIGIQSGLPDSPMDVVSLGIQTELIKEDFDQIISERLLLFEKYKEQLTNLWPRS
eukprot:TRINITY_DN19818_c0_g1_i2.p1 TRINITY_DN19818_c0_g1~~TRINITY_DN19818_c0_g1_i2.p1  ORF type:complete len:162 (+),score=15.62 TRINITY_DN19818_c0_g1_i2:132-617(+)